MDQQDAKSTLALPTWMAVWVVCVGAMIGLACQGGAGAPGVDDCSNLREVQASGDVDGSFGSLGEYDISIQASGEYSVIPPDTSDCAREIAAKLEGACRVCQQDQGSCETTVQSVLDTPSEACSACGDGTCSPSESPGNCPEDCASACGDGSCQGDESFQSCPADCSEGGCGDGMCSAGENPINCPEDCGTACGDGTCDRDESRDTCPEDCTEPCGDGVCSAGENPTNCAEDCDSEPCGNGTCAPGESPILCPQDCGGCVPNQSTCDGSTLVVCNSDGVTATRRQCGSDNVCQNGSCRAEDPEPGQADVELELLGNWRLVVDLVTTDDVDRVITVGNASYILEIFEIEPPDAQFGVWTWKGALKAESMALDDDGGQLENWSPTALGSCSSVTCEATTEVAARGRFNSVSRDFEFTEHVDAPMHYLDGQGFVALSIDPSVEGPLNSGQIGQGDCTGGSVSCRWSFKAEGSYDAAFSGYNGDTWKIRMEKID